MQRFAIKLIGYVILKSPLDVVGDFFSRHFFSANSILLSFFFVVGGNLTAQQDTSNLPSWGDKLFYAETGAAAASLIGLSAIWYNEPSNGFHGFNDAGEWLQMDKVGHLVTAYSIVKINSSLLHRGGMDVTKAWNRSAVLAFTYMLGIEILDGFSPSYGASASDLLANSAGIGLAYLQYRTRTNNDFTLKFNYRMSKYPVFRPNLLGNNATERWLKDYNGQVYWISASARKICTWQGMPNWVAIALGYGVDGVLGGKKNPQYNEAGQLLPEFKRRREFYLALDVDLVKLFGARRKLSRTFELVSFFKMPLPGIQYKDGNVSGFLFFPK